MVRAVVHLADFLLVPTLASLPDIRSTEMFYNQVIGEVAARKELRGSAKSAKTRIGMRRKQKRWNFVSGNRIT